MTAIEDHQRLLSGPLKLTTARWYNKFPDVKGQHGLPVGKPVKRLVNTGPLTQYGYGTDTEPRCPGDYDWCAIGAFHTGVFFIDGDDDEVYAITRTARLVGRADAWSLPPNGFHIPVDGRGVPRDQWPVQGPIGMMRDWQHPEIIYAGADIKSNGWVPLPGSRHWTGGRYEPVFRPDGSVPLVRATPELINAVNADRADYDQAAARGGQGGGGGNGGGHDGQVAAACMGMILKRLRAGWQVSPELKEAVYDEWLTVAIPHDPSRPFGREDFERHYGGEREGGLAKARAILADEAAWMPGAMAWAEDLNRQAQALPTRRPRKPGTRKPGARR
jgi:hypothetical protein